MERNDTIAGRHKVAGQLQAIIFMMREGRSKKEMCYALNISRTSLARIERKHKAIFDKEQQYLKGEIEDPWSIKGVDMNIVLPAARLEDPELYARLKAFLERLNKKRKIM